MTTLINASTSSGLVVSPDNSGAIALQSNGTTAALTNLYGIGLASAVPSSGVGIAFPSTQVASSDPNTLDDYEEGTFSLTYAGGGSSPTINSQSCSYVKIGRSVTVSISIQINLGSTSTTLGTLSGFPFVFATNYATAIAREWYSTGKAIEVIGNIGGTSAPLIFYDNSVSLTGVTILGVGTTFSYVTT